MLLNLLTCSLLEDLYKESIITREQNEALKRAEDARRQGSTRNQAPPTIITKDKMNELREQAVMRLRNLGFEPVSRIV